MILESGLSHLKEGTVPHALTLTLVRGNPSKLHESPKKKKKNKSRIYCSVVTEGKLDQIGAEWRKQKPYSFNKTTPTIARHWTKKKQNFLAV